MIIESAYWNYYMSFRLSDSKRVFRDMGNKNYSKAVAGIALDNTILASTNFDAYFEERKRSMVPLIEKKRLESWNEEFERQLYIENKLPEYYFDFIEKDGQYNDKLRSAYNESDAEIHEINKVFINMTKEINKECWCCMALMPLKIELKPFEYEYCPIYIYLFKNGYGVIKISIKIDGVNTDVISTYPMKKWFGDVKVWEPLWTLEGKNEFKICKDISNEQGITVITHILQQYIYRLFDGNLLDEKRFSCFESFVIADLKPKQLWEINTKASSTEKKEIYHMANPEDFMMQITSERWHEFWQSSYMHFHGFDLIKGHNCRLIISIDPDIMKKQFHRGDIEDYGSYLQVSFQRTFDMFLVIALCQKDGELYLYRGSESDIHNINKKMAMFNQNQNFFENFLDAAPYNGRAFYFIIREINDKSFVDSHVKIERLKQIESYQKSVLDERQTLLFEMVALIASILFGLPGIRETLTILRECLLPPGDLIKGEIIDFLAVITWIFLIAGIICYLLSAYNRYRRKTNE